MELHRFTSRLVSLRSGPTAEWEARDVWADDGSKASWARLAREAEMNGGTEYENELRSIERELFEADWAAARAEHGDDALPSTLPRTSAQRMADAQVEMARRSR